MEQNIPYSLNCDLFSRNLDIYMYISYTYIKYII